PERAGPGLERAAAGLSRGPEHAEAGREIPEPGENGPGPDPGRPRPWACPNRAERRTCPDPRHRACRAGDKRLGKGHGHRGLSPNSWRLRNAFAEPYARLRRGRSPG